MWLSIKEEQSFEPAASDINYNEFNVFGALVEFYVILSECAAQDIVGRTPSGHR